MEAAFRQFELRASAVVRIGGAGGEANTFDPIGDTRESRAGHSDFL
jgi:hypothetical protein